jgi:uncharacterized protein
MTVTPLYAALLGLMYIMLSVRTVHLRRTLKIAIGDRGSPEMLRAMRVHANFAEYVPLTLLLIMMLEMRGGSFYMIHLLCLVLIAGRVIHAIGVSRVDEDYRLRVFGMAMTFSALGLAAALLVTGYLSALPV